MIDRRYGKATLALMLMLILLLTGCASIADPIQQSPAPTPVVTPTPEPTPTPAPVPTESSVPAVVEAAAPAVTGDSLIPVDIPDDLPVVEVSTTDELLNAIASDTVIRLAEGEYNLTQAGSYGQLTENDALFWESGFDGYQLIISQLQNLYLVGSGSGNCRILTDPRYATVLNFRDCETIGLQGLTVGHSHGMGYCCGGVLGFINCRDVLVDACDLYGCGTVGITANGCRSVTANRTVIRECSYGGIEAYSSRNVIFLDGKIVNCGFDPDEKDRGSGFNLIHADTCVNFAVINSEIGGNAVESLFSSYSSVNYRVLGCNIHDNSIGGEYQFGGAFSVRGKPVTVSGSSFVGNTLSVPFVQVVDSSVANPVADANANPLDLESMETMPCVILPADQVSELMAEFSQSFSGSGSGESVSADEWNEVHVSSVDEFLAAIGNHTIIHVDADLLDLSTATGYGSDSGDYYYWTENYDGPGLVITGVEGLLILGQGKDKTLLQVTPRYSDVLYFDSCSDVTVGDLTAGHQKDLPGECAGDVFEFIFCNEVKIQNCGLFGCGVNAIYASQCNNFTISDTEMYECSQFGAQLMNCSVFNFERCSIHDCESNSIVVTDSDNIFWDDRLLEPGDNRM